MDTNDHETVEQTTEAPEQAEETATTETDEQVVDYKAELEHAKKHNRSGYEMRKAKTSDDTVDNDIDIEQAIEKAVDRALTASRQDSVEEKIQSALVGVTDQDERALVEHHYRNSIKVSGQTLADIQRDMQAARAIANASRLVKENQELKRANTARANMSSDSSASAQVVNTPVDNTWNKEQLAYFAKKGIDPKKVAENLNRQ